MKSIIYYALCLVGVAIPLSATIHPTILEEENLGKHFSKAGVTGTWVLFDPQKDTYVVHNFSRARQRFLPASTFKIANALIALDTGVVKDLDEIIPYGGTKEYFKSWEKDMNIVQAMKTSNVAVFHQIARRIGIAIYQKKLASFRYGNRDPGSSIDNRFWLTGPLAISAIEQVQFLQALTNGNLPVKDRVIQLVKETILQEETKEFNLFAKSGWAGPEAPQIGWWVGWVERESQNYPFALNIEIKEDSDAPKRMVIARACLKELGILP